ncbi:hypothetical protein FIBSPDRAFT_1046539 [Athelia psychrophila]|uniref:Uncharacterized protein n=1 Tax=Athelia psychrophila TaxID=1759441 RepID=A0A166GMU1_9AGAM|nr:hypothetical protein FIBSPDRAFT_1046539 [Fibularhizoctonia sp. CBS 109695]
MSTHQDLEPKDYVDRGVQTHACSSTQDLWLTRQPRFTLAKTSNLLAESLNDAPLGTSLIVPSNGSDSAESDSLGCNNLPPDSPSPTRPTARRILDRQLTPFNHPKPRFKKRRIVSLPIDAIDEDRASVEVPDPITLRVVSLPTRLPTSSFLDSSSSSEASFSVAQQIHSPEMCHISPRLLLRRYADTPHTPSPPSSPESVLIIENENQLPRSFLRPKDTRSDYDGQFLPFMDPFRFLTLVAPQGTIIEEHEHLPRMIWGLGPDDAPPGHSRTNSHNPVDTFSRSSAPKFKRPIQPPRFQNQDPAADYLPTPHRTPVFLPQASHLSTDSEDRQTIALGGALGNFGTQHHQERNKQHYTLHNGNTQANNTWDALHADLGTNLSARRSFVKDDEIALDWEMALIQQQRLKQSLIEERSILTTQAPRHLNRSATTFVPSNLTPPLSYPRIFVEPRGVRPYQGQKLTPASVAKHSLPTPPSSASPQWSASFSPYQSSLYSPEMARESFKFPIHTSQQMRPALSDSSTDLRKFVYDRIGTRNSDHTPPSMSLNHRAIPSQMRPEHPRITVSVAPYPGPPPTSPLPPTPDAVFHHGPAAFDMTPPLSPEIRSRSISYQQPRSIPLSRLIQRRLASVPEEEHNSFIQRNRILSSSKPFHRSVDSDIPAHHRQPKPPSTMERMMVHSTSADDELTSTTLCGPDPLELFGELNLSRGGNTQGARQEHASAKVNLPHKLEPAETSKRGAYSDGRKENVLVARAPAGKKRNRPKKNKLVSAGPQAQAELF